MRILPLYGFTPVVSVHHDRDTGPGPIRIAAVARVSAELS